MYHFSAKENCECEKCGESIKFYHLFECKANSLTLSQAASLYIYGIFHISFIFHVCINIMLYADGVLSINIYIKVETVRPCFRSTLLRKQSETSTLSETTLGIDTKRKLVRRLPRQHLP